MQSFFFFLIPTIGRGCSSFVLLTRPFPSKMRGSQRETPHFQLFASFSSLSLYVQLCNLYPYPPGHQGYKYTEVINIYIVCWRPFFIFLSLPKTFSSRVSIHSISLVTPSLFYFCFSLASRISPLKKSPLLFLSLFTSYLSLHH